MGSESITDEAEGPYRPFFFNSEAMRAREINVFSKIQLVS